MTFKDLVSQKLHPLFIEHGLIQTEQSANFATYESMTVTISVSHDVREISNTLWIGNKMSFAVEIDDLVMKRVFNTDLTINNLPMEIFVDRVRLFFSNEGKKLLTGDTELLIALHNFNAERSREYTASLLLEQNIQAANKAWDKKNYIDVVNYLERTELDKLPSSLKQKYKIALKRSKDKD